MNLLKLRTLANAFLPSSQAFPIIHKAPCLVLAVAFGAKVLKSILHWTTASPADHWFSEDPPGLQRGSHRYGRPRRCWAIRSSSPHIRTVHAVLARRSITALRDITEGEPLTMENICLKSPVAAFSPPRSKQYWVHAAHRIKRASY
jgi:sialic acid synthase SpsE